MREAHVGEAEHHAHFLEPCTSLFCVRRLDMLGLYAFHDVVVRYMAVTT